jgi:SAM-dependent methyltransferase
MADLPDIAGLTALDSREWHSLHRRLTAIGLNAAAVAPIQLLCARYPEDERNPIRLWHLRQRSDPAALAMRLLMFGDVLTRLQARAVLGASLFRRLVTAGLLLADGDCVSCVLRLTMAGDYYVLADDLSLGGDVVMGMRETTVPLWRAITPAGSSQRVLDLGCGAGAIALLLCRNVAQVVATDINPRAVALARINVALNGASNVVVREGDLFVPVVGETFDLIAAHPPYVALPDIASTVSHLHGGVRGDELACRLLTELTPHLVPGGRAVLQVHWPFQPDEPPTARIRAAAGNDLDLLELRLGAADADDLATFWGQLQPDPASAIGRVRDHYARLGIAGTLSSLCVLRRRAAPGWTCTLDVPPASLPFVTADRIDVLLRVCDLLQGGDASLLAARLRLPQGATLTSTKDAGGIAHQLVLLPATTLRPAAEANVETWQMLLAVDRALNVGVSRQDLSAVRAALSQGLLEPE